MIKNKPPVFRTLGHSVEAVVASLERMTGFVREEVLAKRPKVFQEEAK